MEKHKNSRQFKSKFDLIYSSHSLEHVNNIENTLVIFKNISHEDTIYFLKFLIV